MQLNIYLISFHFFSSYLWIIIKTLRFINFFIFSPLFARSADGVCGFCIFRAKISVLKRRKFPKQLQPRQIKLPGLFLYINVMCQSRSYARGGGQNLQYGSSLIQKTSPCGEVFLIILRRFAAQFGQAHIPCWNIHPK